MPQSPRPLFRLTPRQKLLLPRAGAVLGFALLMAAWPLGLMFKGSPNLENIHEILNMVWGFPVFALLLISSHPHFSPPTRWRLWAVTVLFSYSVFTMRDPAGNHVYVTTFTGLLGLGLLGASLWHWLACPARIYRALRAFSWLLPRKCYPWLLALALFTASAMLASACFGFLPAMVDSTAQYVQAKFMAHGQLTGETTPLSASFPIWMMVWKNHVFAQYQPLHIMLLAIGHILHAPGLVNPFLAGVTLLAAYALAKRIFGEKTARLSALFMLCSQFILFMSAEYMNHVSALCFTTLFMLCCIKTLDAASAGLEVRAKKLGFLTGACFGAGLLIRPFSAVGTGLPFLCVALLRARRDRKLRAPLAMASIATLACLCFQFWYNDQTSGDWLMFPSAQYHMGSTSTALGFNAQPFSFTYLIAKAQHEWWQMNFYLFDWPVPCLLPLALYCLRPSRAPYARLLLLSIITHTLLNMVNQFHNAVFGPRYMYETSVCLIILSAAGILRLPILLGALQPRRSRQDLRALCATLTLALFTAALLERLPQNMAMYASGYFDNAPSYYQSLLSQANPPALIFMGHTNNPGLLDYATASAPYRKVAFTYPPQASDPVIFAADISADANQKIIDAYPNRHVYFEQNGIIKLLKQTQ